MGRTLPVSFVLIALVSCASVEKTETDIIRPIEIKLVQIDFEQFRRADSSRATSAASYAPTTKMEFGVFEHDSTTVMVLDSNGKLISNVWVGLLDIGAYRIDFDIKDLASGVYVARYKVGNEITTKRFLVVR